MSRGKVACRFDELTIDTPRNRFIRSALESLSRIVQEGTIARKCRSLGAMLRKIGVVGENPGIRGMSNEVFGRNDAIEKPIMELAKLAFRMAVLAEEVGATAMPVPDREEIWARKLFEKGIAGFYSAVLPAPEWMVEAGKHITWRTNRMTPGIGAYLPAMITDIIVQNINSGRRIIIDTKFTEILKTDRFGRERLRSGYVYQIYSYLRSQERAGDDNSTLSEGILLHPSIGYEFDEEAEIQGHCIRFATIDLSASIQDIRDRLLEIVEGGMSAERAADGRAG
jgi:5-methylcytosine-specific restriction enzyme subunit McrC